MVPDSLAAPSPPAPDGRNRSGKFSVRPEKHDIVVRHPPAEGHRSAFDGAGRLIVVSNREPYFRDDGGGWHRNAGGLVSALEPVMRRAGGVWLAWNPGIESHEASTAEVPAENPSFTLLQVPVTAAEIHGFYDGCANRALWPLCHYAFETCHFNADDWKSYATVNRRFARQVVATADGDDVVWIHDYHFFLMPQLVRQRGLEAPIVFFLHVPFPNAECFVIFPWRRELLEGMLGADLIGFHTAGYQRNFLRSVRRVLGASIDETSGEISWCGRTVRTGAFPIGIDYRAMRRLSESAETKREAAQLRDAHGGRSLILGVDRLDYSKGILEKLAAIECLFDSHPEHRKNVDFIQITVPSRTDVIDYRRLKGQIDKAVARINLHFSEDGWAPIHHHYGYLPHAQLAAWYAAADVAFVAPRRDGMNLVSKEYVACQSKGNGVLILSEFAGSAVELACGALLVNPFDTVATAGALHGSLAMPAAERARRMRSMRKVVRGHDIHHWVAEILSAVKPAQTCLSGRPLAETAVAIA